MEAPDVKISRLKIKSHQPGLPMPNITKKPLHKMSKGLPQSEVQLTPDDKLETCLHLSTFIQTKVNLSSESDLKGTFTAVENDLHTDNERTKGLSMSPRKVTGLLERASGMKSCRKTTNVNDTEGHKRLSPKKKLPPKDARHRLRLSAAADATFEMQKDQQKSIVDHVDDTDACAGSSEVREHLRLSEDYGSDWGTNYHGHKEETVNSTFLVEQDAGLVKSVDTVQNDLSKKCAKADWSNATFQVESGLTELEGQAQRALGLTYAAMTDDDKVELEVLPESEIDYYRTCYDVSLSSAKASSTHLLNNGLNPVVDSVSDHLLLCSMNKQRKVNASALDCGAKPDRSLSTNSLDSELSNYHQVDKGNNHSVLCYENLTLTSGIIGSQFRMPSPHKGMSSPSTDNALELNLTFLHTSTPKSLAENVSWFPGGRLQAQTRSKVVSDRQSEPTRCLVARFSDALLDNNGCLTFDPFCRPKSSAGNARIDFKSDGKSVLDESVECKSSSTEAFNEIEFEVFENEDYRIMPKNSELGSGLENICNPRHLSIVDLNEENMASFFLTDVVNLTHLCRMSYSADNINVGSQQQSKASPGLLQKSFSSPDKFSDLSFARLPIFGAEIAPKAESNVSNLNLEKHFKESHRTRAFVSGAASEMSVGLNDLVDDLKKFDALYQNTGLCLSNTCRKTGCAAEFEHQAKVNRSSKNDVGEDVFRLALSSTHANDICIGSAPGYNDRLHFQDAFSSSDALNFANSGQMNEVKPVIYTMTTAPPCSSVNLTPGVDSNAAAAAAAVSRPASSTRRQLPVLQVATSGAVLLSRVSPQLPQKVAEKTNSSTDNCIMVQLEMEKHVKVEMVKQVKVNCAVQEKCESRLPSAVLNKDDHKIAGTSSARNSPRSPLESFLRRSNRTSKIGIPVSKAPAVPSGRSSTAQPPREQQKDGSQSERSGAMSAPPVGIQNTIHKGTSRQLPNADLVKHTKQKETAESKAARPEPAKADHVQQLRRLSVFKNIEKMSGSSKTTVAVKPSNVVTKPMLENSDGTSSKIGRASISGNSSASSSASAVPDSQTAQRRSLRHYQVTATSSSQKHGRLTQVAAPGARKSSAELKSVKEEPKRAGLNENRAPETNFKALSGKKKPNDALVVRKSRNLSSGLPAMKQILLSVVSKAPVSSRRASNSSSVCSSIKGETGGQNSAPVHSQSPSEKKMKGIKSVENTVIVQYPHQPDVVSNSVLRELPIEKLHQLEVQCQDMARRLHSSEGQLKERTTAFEAMITVVKYYVQQMTSLTENISVLRSQLVSSGAKCDVLMHHRNSLIAEIQGLKEDHEVEVNGMTVTHQMELHALQEKTKAVIKEVEETYLKMAATLQQDTQRLIDDLRSEHKRELEVQGQSVSDAKAKHKKKLTDLQRSHENQLKDLKAQFEAVKSTLVEKMDHLNAECLELRQRNQNLLEADPSASNNFVTPEADKQAENLKQEVESLKVVVELRNQENNKLRKQNAALVAQLETLAEAKQRIHQLEQKLENTEAIVHMKSDYERELAEKHTTLLRRYSKESKVNKRLSMNNEELMWKLNQAAAPLSPTSPNPIRRTHSGPPTKSAPGTPLIFRRSQPDMDSHSFFSTNDSAQNLEDSD